MSDTSLPSTLDNLYRAVIKPGRKPFEQLPTLWRSALIGSHFDLVDRLLSKLIVSLGVPKSALLCVAHEAAPYCQYLPSWSAFQTHVCSLDSLPSVGGELLAEHKVEGQATDLDIEVVKTNNRYDITGFYTGENPAAEDYHGFKARFSRLSLIFQAGDPAKVGKNGVTMESLLAVCKHRLTGFQASPFACDENQQALDHISQALEILKGRTRRRINQQVEGTHSPERPVLPEPPAVRTIGEPKPHHSM